MKILKFIIHTYTFTLLFIILFQLSIKQSYAQCTSFPCIDESTNTGSCSNLDIVPPLIYGTDPTNPNDRMEDASPNFSLKFKTTGKGELCAQYGSRDSLTGYKTVCDTIRNPSTQFFNKIINLNFQSGFTRIRDTIGTAGIRQIDVLMNGTKYCSIFVEIKSIDILPSKTPTPTPTPLPSDYVSCTLTVNPSYISQTEWENKSVSMVTVEGLILVTFSREDFLRGNNLYAKLTLNGNYNTSFSREYTPQIVEFIPGQFIPIQNKYLENKLKFTQQIDLNNFLKDTYTIKLNKIVEGFLQINGHDLICQTNLTIGNPLPSATPTKTPKEIEEEQDKQNLKKVCESIKAESDERKRCEACTSGKKIEQFFYYDTPGAYTALGCIPSDLGTFINKYLFVIGLGFAGAIAFLLMLWGSFLIILSQGDPQKIQEGKEIILSAVIGILFVIFSVAIFRIITADVIKLPGFS